MKARLLNIAALLGLTAVSTPDNGPRPASSPRIVIPSPASPPITIVTLSHEEMFKTAKELGIRLERFERVDAILDISAGILLQAEDAERVPESRVLRVDGGNVIILVSPCPELV